MTKAWIAMMGQQQTPCAYACELFVFVELESLVLAKLLTSDSRQVTVQQALTWKFEVVSGPYDVHVAPF